MQNGRRKESTETQIRHQTQAMLNQDDDFYLNKLNWIDVPLVGRDNVLKDMIQNYQSMINVTTATTTTANEEYEACNTKFHRVVTIHGKSGTGKSKLAMKLKDYIDNGDDIGFFVVGKFDVQHQQAMSPYRVFVAGMYELMKQIWYLQDGTLRKGIISNLSQSISSQDIPLLLPTIPGLSKLLSFSSISKETDGEEHQQQQQQQQQADIKSAVATSDNDKDVVVDTAKRRKRLQYLFRKFVLSVCCVNGVGGDNSGVIVMINWVVVFRSC